MELAEAIAENPISSLVTTILLVVLALVYQAFWKQADPESAQLMDQIYTLAVNGIELLAFVGTLSLVVMAVMWLKNQ